MNEGHSERIPVINAPMTVLGMKCLICACFPINEREPFRTTTIISPSRTLSELATTGLTYTLSASTISPLLTLEERSISSFIPEQKSWIAGLNNSDFYFCEIQKADASQYGMSGDLVNEGNILLNACNTDWRKWNKRPEELKTAAVLRSENEAKGAAPAFVKYQKGCSAFYVSTLTDFANSEKGFNVLAHILKQAGIPHEKPEVNTADVFFLRDGVLQFPASIKDKFEKDGDSYSVNLWVFSPRPLDDLLIEPNMPKLSLFVESRISSLLINGKNFDAVDKKNPNAIYNELPLLQGWNKIVLKIGQDDKDRFNAYFKCDNKPDFLPLGQM